MSDGGRWSGETASLMANALFEASPGLVAVVTPDGGIESLNRSPLQDRAVEDFVGHDVAEFVASGKSEVFHDALRAALAEQRPVDIEIESNFGLWLHVRLIPLELEGRARVLCVGTDITARRAAERTLAEQRERYRFALQATGMGAWSWHVPTDTLYWDDNTQRLFGVTEETAPTDYPGYLALTHPDDRDRVDAFVRRCVESASYDFIEHRVVRPDGSERWVMGLGNVVKDDAGNLIELMGAVLDITDRKLLEEQVVHAQKLETVGSLTAGIAHNFNNVLTVVLSSLELATRAPDERRPGLVEDALSATRRGTDLVRQLMSFARRQPARRGVTDLRDVMESALSMARQTIDRSVSIDGAAPEVPVWVRADARHLEQMLLNLILNARDAIEEAVNEAPRIELELDRVVLSGAEGLAVRMPADTSVARLRVRDNGPGMSADVRARVFEPFYTTKGSGGTGLGLASALTTVRDHGGWMGCKSERGQGASFTVLLPTCSPSSAPETPRDDDVPAGRGEVVLLIDDEAPVRRSVRLLLDSCGYRALTAASGDEGLEIIARADPPVELVMLDLSMPVSGEIVLQQIRSTHPDLRVVLFTGYVGKTKTLHDVAEVLEKPVSHDQLLHALHRVLRNE